MLSSCGGTKEAVKEASYEVPEELVEPDTTVYNDNEKVDLRKPEFRSEDDEDEEVEVYVVDKVILHYYNEDGKCNKEGKEGRGFYVWCQGFEGYEYSNAADAEHERVEYSTDGTMMTLTMDLKTDPIFKQYYGCASIMYIIKFKMGGLSDLNWGGQSEDVELKFSEFPPNAERVVEVWSTPAAGGGIAQFDSEEKTKVEGVKLAKFTNWKTITCDLSANAGTVKWQLYAFDETYFKVKAKNRAAIKKNYLVKEGTNSTKQFTIPFTYNVHINAVYSIESYDTSTDGSLKKIVYVSFEDLYGTSRFETYYTYSGSDLGVTYSAEETTFKVWSPVAANVSLYLYNTDTSAAYDGKDNYKGWHMNYQPGGIWTLTVKGDLAHDDYKYFNYYVDTWSTSGVCMDPYATGCGACGLRGLVYDKSETIPTGWDTMESHLEHISTPQDLTIYEVHVQDFTGDESWGGPEEERGTYNGFVKSGTKLPGTSITTGFDHLKELKPGAVQFVPVFDADNDEVKNTKYNWGYNPLNYNCVEGAYSSNPHDGLVRISEFKNMINELGKAGMRTIMDVVYNHVSSPTASCFNKLMPRYYFRYAKQGDAEVNLGWIQPGELYDGSGCHNEFKSEATMARKFIVDSVCMWATDYKVKGFRFDLMALIDTDTMQAVKEALGAIDTNIYIYGEGWTADRYHGKDTWVNGVHKEKSYGTFAVPGEDNEYHLDTNHGYQVFSELYQKSPGECWLGAFDGSGRDALKGSNDINGYGGNHRPNYGFINKGRGDVGDMAGTLANMVYGRRADMGGANPKQNIAYASCHDNWTLRDHLYYTLGEPSVYDGNDGAYCPHDGTGTPPNVWEVLHGVIATEALVFSSNCAAFMLGGEELLRTKEIINSGANRNVTDEEFDKIPVTSYETLYGHICSHNSYNSPINVNSFKWGNKQTVTIDGNSINMVSENLTAQFASLIALHKEMPKYDYTQVETIWSEHKTTKGNNILNFAWYGSYWADADVQNNSVVCIQYDEWFIYIAGRSFGYVKDGNINLWTKKAGVGAHNFNSGTSSLDLGISSPGDPTNFGLACVVYQRG